MLLLLIAVMCVLVWLPSPVGWFMPVNDSCVDSSLQMMFSPGWAAFASNVLLPALVLLALLAPIPGVRRALRPTRSEAHTFSALAAMLAIDWICRFSPSIDAFLTVMLSGVGYVLFIFILGLRLAVAGSVLKLAYRLFRRRPAEQTDTSDKSDDGHADLALVMTISLTVSGLFFIAYGSAGPFAFNSASPEAFENHCFEYARAVAQDRSDIPKPRLRP